MSSFSATEMCVVASRKREPLRLKLASAALMSRNERWMKQSLHRITSTLGRRSLVTSATTKVLPGPQCSRRLRAINSGTTSAPVYSIPPRST
jgi:hypothetical protein